MRNNKKDPFRKPLSLDFNRENPDALLVYLAVNWSRDNRLQNAHEIEKQLEMGPQIKRLLFKTENITV